ncbi:unnamed protein product [Ectocarpus sp. 12 AP-2014]
MIIKLRGSARPCRTLIDPNRYVGSCTMRQGLSYYCTDENTQEGDGYDSLKKAIETQKERQTPKWAIVEYSSTPTRQKKLSRLHPRRKSRNKKRIAILLAEVNVHKKKSKKSSYSYSSKRAQRTTNCCPRQVTTTKTAIVTTHATYEKTINKKEGLRKNNAPSPPRNAYNNQHMYIEQTSSTRHPTKQHTDKELGRIGGFIAKTRLPLPNAHLS